jgi:hypothetical protein
VVRKATIEENMKQRDKGKVSLVEFLRSLKYSRGNRVTQSSDCGSHFARFEQRVDTGRQFSAEEYKLVRSAN